MQRHSPLRWYVRHSTDCFDRNVSQSHRLARHASAKETSGGVERRSSPSSPLMSSNQKRRRGKTCTTPSTCKGKPGHRRVGFEYYRVWITFSLARGELAFSLPQVLFVCSFARLLVCVFSLVCVFVCLCVWPFAFLLVCSFARLLVCQPKPNVLALLMWHPTSQDSSTCGPTSFRRTLAAGGTMPT
jgi:hypothetical protein